MLPKKEINTRVLNTFSVILVFTQNITNLSVIPNQGMLVMFSVKS